MLDFDVVEGHRKDILSTYILHEVNVMHIAAVRKWSRRVGSRAAEEFIDSFKHNIKTCPTTEVRLGVFARCKGAHGVNEGGYWLTITMQREQIDERLHELEDMNWEKTLRNGRDTLYRLYQGVSQAVLNARLGRLANRLWLRLRSRK